LETLAGIFAQAMDHIRYYFSPKTNQQELPETASQAIELYA